MSEGRREGVRDGGSECVYAWSRTITTESPHWSFAELQANPNSLPTSSIFFDVKACWWVNLK